MKWKPHRRLKTTRGGKILIGVALASGFAAMNTGNNLLFLGWAFVLSTIVLSGVLSELCVRAVVVRVQPPYCARVGETSWIDLGVDNPSRFRVHALVTRLRLTTGQLLDAGPLAIAPAQSVTTRVALSPTQRGAHEISEVVVSTLFPFGLFEKQRVVLGPWPTFFAAPRKVHVELDPAGIRTQVGLAHTGRAGRDGDFLSLRPYRPGDNPRHIHWRKSLRRERPVIGEREALASLVVALCLDVRALDQTAQEHTIAYAASLCDALFGSLFSISLCLPGHRSGPWSGSDATEVLGIFARLHADHLTLPPPVGVTPIWVRADGYGLQATGFGT